LVAVLIAVAGQLPLTAADKEVPPDYYPLKVGTKWHYRVEANGQPGQMVSQITKIEQIDGQKLARLEVTAQEKPVASEHLRSSDKGIFRHRYNGLEIAPPFCIRQYPVKEGAAWESENKIATKKRKASGRAGKKKETVEVPAGKFDAVTVRIESEADGRQISTVYWFVDRIGVVKQTMDLGGIQITMELEV
jgi:hypothetical protein